MIWIIAAAWSKCTAVYVRTSQAIRQTYLLNNISAAFSKCDLGESNYDIGDIEISISVDVNGEVSVLSAAGLSTGSEAAMKINLRRKNGKD